ncbi:MAG: energy transducer TonB, partial [Psychrobium sp.]|nr:energy transducer TonB [Psychrobium sp.]
MLKTILSLALAAIVTFALFAFMAFLVTSEGIRLTEKTPATQISINPEKEDTKTRQTVRIKAIPPPVDSPPPAIALQPAVDSETTSINFELPNVNVGGIDSQLHNPQGAMNRDGDATP